MKLITTEAVLALSPEAREAYITKLEQTVRDLNKRKVQLRALIEEAKAEGDAEGLAEWTEELARKVARSKLMNAQCVELEELA